MPRQLRTRNSRPNYATVLHYDDGGEAGPSNANQVAFDDSGSDFAPDETAGNEEVEEEDELEDELAENEEAPLSSKDVRRAPSSDGEGSVQVVSAPGAGQKTSTVTKKKKGVSLVSGLPYQSTRQMYALPSLHHRHRAVPIFDRVGQVERLVNRPKPFEHATLASTNSWSHNPATTERIGKSWGYNVGPGPLWELMEDRGWFKESIASGGEGAADEKYRRPRVHEEITVQKCEIISSDEASSYLPWDDTEESPLKRAPPIPCSFGPFGSQTRIEMAMFESRRIAEFIPESKSHVFNAGAPVWGIDWCPIHPGDRSHYAQRQFLAVGPLQSRSYSPSIGVRVQRPSRACIQIWSLGMRHDAMEVDGVPDRSEDDLGEMRCEMVLCIDSGPAYELKWCPLPSNDPAQYTNTETTPRKLGILAGTFADGSLSLYVVPDPASLSGPSDGSSPIYVQVAEPLLRLELEETLCWAIDWANSDVMAVGCTNGSIAVCNVGKALRNPANAIYLLPTHYFNIHQSAIRTIAWVRTPTISTSGKRTADDPMVIASGGYDGVECLTDIRELTGNVMNRTRDVVNSLCFSTYCGGPVTIDHENIVKSYSLSPGMLGRGHAILEPDGPVWSLSASDYHAQLAIGVTDGSCLTTNTLKSTRRGGSVPFFVHQIYQLDYSRKDKEWRMLERFLPKESIDRPTASRSNKIIPVGTGAWPREVGVQRVVWNQGNGLACAPWLASATGSGLCRVDWLLGRWIRDRVPYYGIEGIRGEIDEEDSD
ncbi:hypothetical protein WOLCODRAFT_95877 [Wolfiporia cocos MD-104 SS10]|uniref:WD40 repeat-like protein n=1 Tax=Wolfiporia cocos (strain MD-104) TaxID=742152 RepID=A0A2H3JGB8_WOLCO|nr:hypothetical protein WOLCODRAFT_95877 [Wolfiporia cocos MD-104 SS10]